MTCEIIYYRGGGGRNGSEKTAVERNYGRAGETMITRTICCWGGGGDDTTNFYDDFVRDKLCMSEGREFLISNFLCDFVSVIFLIIFNRFYRNLFIRRIISYLATHFALKISVKQRETACVG